MPWCIVGPAWSMDGSMVSQQDPGGRHMSLQGLAGRTRPVADCCLLLFATATLRSIGHARGVEQRALLCLLTARSLTYTTTES